MSLENPKELEKSQIFSWKLSKYIGQGVPLPPWKKNSIAVMDELEHEISQVFEMLSQILLREDHKWSSYPECICQDATFDVKGWFM